VKVTGTAGAAKGAARAEENREKTIVSVTNTVSTRKVMFLFILIPPFRYKDYESYFWLANVLLLETVDYFFQISLQVYRPPSRTISFKSFG
jgi:hypothetical protein